MGLVLLHGLFLWLLSPAPIQKKIKRALTIYSLRDITRIAATALLFFIIHGILLLSLQQINYLTCSLPNLLSTSFWYTIGLGIPITFLLAWSEEIIFRGIFFTYINHYMDMLPSILCTATFFMFAHNLQAPWQLIGRDWRLGFGLLLLGILFNQIYVCTQRLSYAIGAHMGLVLLKVVLRKLPCIQYNDTATWGYSMHTDIRQAGIAHALLLTAIVVLTYYYGTRKQQLSTLHN